MSEVLFREKSVAEVRDVSVQLGKDVVVLREEFREQLRSSYEAVIETNEGVHGLYGRMQQLDVRLLQLCFGEEELLPRVSDTGAEGRLESSVEARAQARAESRDYEKQGVEQMLHVGAWVVCLARFRQEPSSSEALAQLVSAFDGLRVDALVLKSCREFGRWIVQEQPLLSLDAYLRLLGLVELEQYRFERETRAWLFGQILAHPDVLSANVSSEVMQFMRTAAFRAAMTQRLVEQCTEELERWAAQDESAAAAAAARQLDPYDTDKSVATLVSDLNLYELGLCDSRRVAFHIVKTNVTAHLAHLHELADEATCKAVSDRLHALVDAERLRLEPQTGNTAASRSPLSMDALVASLMTERNNAHYLEYLAQ